MYVKIKSNIILIFKYPYQIALHDHSMCSMMEDSLNNHWKQRFFELDYEDYLGLDHLV